jgi:hypothetical protein
MSIELPHRKVLILAAICASIILISLSYKVVGAKKLAIYNNSITAEAGQNEEQGLADKRVLDALEQARQEELGDLASSTNPFLPSTNDTVSDRFAKDVFAAYLKYQQSDGNISDEELSQDAITNIKTDFLPKPKYNLAELQIFVPQTKGQIRKYGNDLAQAYIETVAKVNKLPPGDTRASLLTPIYREIASRFIHVPAPEQIAVNQLNLTNSMQMLGDALILIDQQSDDPIKALLGLRVVQDQVPDQADMFIKMSDFFTQNGILFDDNEYGAIWNPRTINASSTTSVLTPQP